MLRLLEKLKLTDPILQTFAKMSDEIAINFEFRGKSVERNPFIFSQHFVPLEKPVAFSFNFFTPKIANATKERAYSCSWMHGEPCRESLVMPTNLRAVCAYCRCSSSFGGDTSIQIGLSVLRKTCTILQM